MARQQPTLDQVREFAPKLMQVTDDVLFGDIWEREGLSPRERSLIVVATLTALYRTNELPSHIKRAIANGITREELSELFTHLAFYAGWPCAITAIRTAIEVLDE